MCQDFGVLHERLDDVPSLLSGGGDETADDGEVPGAFLAAEAAGDFLLEFHHAPVLLGLIVGEGHVKIVDKAQYVVAAGFQTQGEVMAGSALSPAPAFAQCGDERRLGLMKSNAFGDDSFETSLDERDQARFQRLASVA